MTLKFRSYFYLETVKFIRLSLFLHVKYCSYQLIYEDKKPTTIQFNSSKLLGPYCLIMGFLYVI